MRGRAPGFSLIETILALAVLSMVLVGLSSRQGLDRQTQAEAQRFAQDAAIFAQYAAAVRAYIGSGNRVTSDRNITAQELEQEGFLPQGFARNNGQRLSGRIRMENFDGIKTPVPVAVLSILEERRANDQPMIERGRDPKARQARKDRFYLTLFKNQAQNNVFFLSHDGKTLHNAEEPDYLARADMNDRALAYALVNHPLYNTIATVTRQWDRGWAGREGLGGAITSRTSSFGRAGAGQRTPERRSGAELPGERTRENETPTGYPVGSANILENQYNKPGAMATTEAGPRRDNPQPYPREAVDRQEGTVFPPANASFLRLAGTGMLAGGAATSLMGMWLLPSVMGPLFFLAAPFNIGFIGLGALGMLFGGALIAYTAFRGETVAQWGKWALVLLTILMLIAGILSSVATAFTFGLSLVMLALPLILALGFFLAGVISAFFPLTGPLLSILWMLLGLLTLILGPLLMTVLGLILSVPMALVVGAGLLLIFGPISAWIGFRIWRMRAGLLSVIERDLLKHNRRIVLGVMALTVLGLLLAGLLGPVLLSAIPVLLGLVIGILLALAGLVLGGLLTFGAMTLMFVLGMFITMLVASIPVMVVNTLFFAIFVVTVVLPFIIVGVALFGGVLIGVVGGLVIFAITFLPMALAALLGGVMIGMAGLGLALLAGFALPMLGWTVLMAGSVILAVLTGLVLSGLIGLGSMLA